MSKLNIKPVADHVMLWRKIYLLYARANQPQNSQLEPDPGRTITCKYISTSKV